MSRIARLMPFIGLAAPICASAQPAASIRWEPYSYTYTSGDSVAGQLGSLQVPLTRSPATAERLELKFVRLPAHSGVSGKPIIYLAGGPGSSGIEVARGDRFRLIERLRDQGDVILLDQRGVGLSAPPPPCSTPWSFPTVSAATEGTVNASLVATVGNCAREWRAKGVRLEAYTTAENAADVAALIGALGHEKARLVGISYGTFLGLAVLRDYGGLVERAVFAGIEGPDHTLKLPSQADAALERLSTEMEASGMATGLEPLVRRVFAKLSAAPATVQSGDHTSVISLYDAQVVTTFLMATSENAVRLPALFDAMDKGNYAPVARLIQMLSGFYGALPAMPLATDAASGASTAREREVSRLAAGSLFGNAVNFPSADLAKALGVRVLPARYRSPVQSAVPTLFISGTLDSRTPPANAEEVRKGFARSAHLVLVGAGHDNDLFLSTPEILDRIASHLGGARLADETLAVHLYRKH